jgi:hypothetical protein
MPEPGTEPKSSVSELAAQIKFHLATYKIDATPKRVGSFHSSQAEEPITARIRRKIEAWDQEGAKDTGQTPPEVDRRP